MFMSKNNKKYDYKFEIEEYTEGDLFEDGLDKNQKEKIKKRMSMLLEELKEANSKFNINVSLSSKVFLIYLISFLIISIAVYFDNVYIQFLNNPSSLL